MNKFAAILLFLATGVAVAQPRPRPSDAISEEGVYISKDSSDFVRLSEAVPDVILEPRYYSTYNFVGARVDGYVSADLFLTKQAAVALAKANEEVKRDGYRFKVYDAYRPQKAVNHFIRWAEALNDTLMKPYFYPYKNKDVLFEEGYIAERSGHSRGSTVDLTLFDMRTGHDVDMGGTFDRFDLRSHPQMQDSITTIQYENRMYLRDKMTQAGFLPISTEWWHFTLRDEPYPDTYFDF